MFSSARDKIINSIHFTDTSNQGKKDFEILTHLKCNLIRVKIKPLKVLGADVISPEKSISDFLLWFQGFFTEFVGRSLSFLFLPFFAILEVNNV